MSARAFRLDLKPWRWGFVVLQEHYDEVEFKSAIIDHGGAGFLDTYMDNYRRMQNAGGFCSVPDHPVPWLICLFTSHHKSVNAAFVHEAVHLGEYLLISEGVPLTTRTAEVRAQLVQHAIELFEDWQAGNPVPVPKETSQQAVHVVPTRPERRTAPTTRSDENRPVYIFSAVKESERGVMYQGERCIKTRTAYSFTKEETRLPLGSVWTNLGPYGKFGNLKPEIQEALDADGFWEGTLYAPLAQFETPAFKEQTRLMYEIAKTDDPVRKEELVTEYIKTKEPGNVPSNNAAEKIVEDLYKKTK